MKKPTFEEFTATESQIIKTYTYGDFCIDVLKNTLRGVENYEAWIYHKEYGIKSHIIGLRVCDVSYTQFLMMIFDNIEEDIRFYTDEYMDE